MKLYFWQSRCDGLVWIWFWILTGFYCIEHWPIYWPFITALDTTSASYFLIGNIEGWNANILLSVQPGSNIMNLQIESKVVTDKNIHLDSDARYWKARISMETKRGLPNCEHHRVVLMKLVGTSLAVYPASPSFIKQGSHMLPLLFISRRPDSLQSSIRRSWETWYQLNRWRWPGWVQLWFQVMLSSNLACAQYHVYRIIYVSFQLVSSSHLWSTLTDISAFPTKIFLTGKAAGKVPMANQ